MDNSNKDIKDNFKAVLWGFLVLLHFIIYIVLGPKIVGFLLLSIPVWYFLIKSSIGQRLQERIESEVEKNRKESTVHELEAKHLESKTRKLNAEASTIESEELRKNKLNQAEILRIGNEDTRKNRLHKAQMQIENYKLSIRKNAQAAIRDEDLRGDKFERSWYSQLIAEAKSVEDESIEKYLKRKKRPAIRASDEVKALKNQKKELTKKLKVAEYQLMLYEENFPIIEDLKDYLLEDDEFMHLDTDSSEIDPAKKYLKPEEYEKLPVNERNQRALNNYINRKHSKLEIGRFYERYIGHLYEKEGWKVKYFGIIEGFDDLGRDLICSKDNTIEIVQTKNWASHKTIREKYIYQHFATTLHYKLQHNIKKNIKVKSKFISTINCSDMAKQVCQALDIDYEVIPFSKDYPMIKCNINPSSKEKIYHLPIDQQYDRIIIGDVPGEKYVLTVNDAEEDGFRRAFKYKGNFN